MTAKKKRDNKQLFEVQACSPSAMETSRTPQGSGNPESLGIPGSWVPGSPKEFTKTALDRSAAAANTSILRALALNRFQLFDRLLLHLLSRSCH